MVGPEPLSTLTTPFKTQNLEALVYSRFHTKVRTQKEQAIITISTATIAEKQQKSQSLVKMQNPELNLRGTSVEG